MAAPSTNVTIDLSNYKSKVGDRVKEGRYRVVVEDVELDNSKQGNPMINLWLRVIGGPSNDAVIIDRLVLTERSLFRAVGFMQAIGLPTPKKRLNVNTALWIGKTLVVDVADGDPYNGRVKSEVRGYERDVRDDREPDYGTPDGLDEFAPKPSSDEIAAGVGQAGLEDGLAVVQEDEAGAEIHASDEVDLDDLNL